MGLVWERDGRDWPHRGASRFIQAGGLRWHVQQMGRPMGEGPTILLLHGTGASTHSFRALAPILARHATVIAPDLPGHGFTELPVARLQSLPGMAQALAALLSVLGAKPDLVVGHSAGAAILARMCLDGAIAPRALVSLNGAILPLPGMPVGLLASAAKRLVGLPPVRHIFAWRAADRAVIQKLLAGTGSVLDAAGVEFYARLARNPGHVAGALGMMANWDLQPLARDLPRLRTPLHLVVGSADRTIPPTEAARIRALLPAATLTAFPGLGHLAHEERPEAVAELILGLLVPA